MIETKQPFSLVVITLNEEDNIERCIRSVPFASEVVVLDSGSSDKTQSLAKNLSAKVFEEPFRGYYLQKVRATELAQNDWILSLDADETLSPQLQKEILGVLSAPLDDVDAFSMPRLSYHLGRWIRHGGWYPDRQTRLFHRRRANWSADQVHERIRGGRVRLLNHPIHHFVFRNLSDQIDTNNEYSTLGAKGLHEKGKKFSLLKLIVKPISKFIECYVWKSGFKDGLPGFIIAVGAAYSVFLKFAKLWEMQKRFEGISKTETKIQ